MSLHSNLVSFDLKPNLEEIFSAPKLPFGIFISSQNNSLSFAAVKFESNLDANVLEEINLPLNLSYSIIHSKCLICWSDTNEQVAFIHNNEFKCILDFKNKRIYANPLYLKTRNWSYIQYSSHHIPKDWFPYIARTQKNKLLRNACISLETPLQKLLVYKEALKTEVIVPITAKEKEEHYIVSFKLNELNIVCVFVDMLAASNHLPEQEHYKTIPFSELCKHCLEFDIHTLQLYTEYSEAVLISQEDMKTLALGSSQQDTEKKSSEFNWVSSFFEDFGNLKSLKDIRKEFKDIFQMCPQIQTAYMLKPKFENSFIWICIISNNLEKEIPSYFYDRFHQLKNKIPDLNLHSEYSVLEENEDLSKDILKFCKNIYTKE